MSMKQDEIFEHEKHEYVLRVWGPMFDHPLIAEEGLKPGRHYFDTIEQAWYMYAELQIMRYRRQAGNLFFEIVEGKHVRYYSVAHLLYMHNFKTYMVKYDFQSVVDEQLAKEAFIKGSLSCDCSRSALLRKYNKAEDVQIIPCGNTIELLNIRIEHVKRQEAVQ